MSLTKKEINDQYLIGLQERADCLKIKEECIRAAQDEVDLWNKTFGLYFYLSITTDLLEKLYETECPIEEIQIRIMGHEAPEEHNDRGVFTAFLHRKYASTNNYNWVRFCIRASLSEIVNKFRSLVLTDVGINKLTLPESAKITEEVIWSITDDSVLVSYIVEYKVNSNGS